VRDAPLRVLIVDDEAPARAKATRLLAADARFAKVGEAASGLEALRAIEVLAPDVVVLDVQMPGATGFDVLEALGAERRFAVVFSTAHDAHALRAFEAHAVDYLLKPYDAARFARALDKARAQLVGATERERVETLIEGRAPVRIALRGASGWISVEVASITRLAASGKHVEVFVDGEPAPIAVRQTLAAMLARLGPDRFCRVHRSEVVRLDAVVRLEPLSHGDAVLVLRDGSSVVLSRTHRRPFQARWAPG
jgi:two-component system, LytTR family, response regulator